MSRTLGAVVPGLSHTDTCDRCCGVARLAVLIGDSCGIAIETLMFCFHHANKHEMAIFASGRVLVYSDTRREFLDAMDQRQLVA